mmetsp:Transcript_82217/g.129441  ORF Transcript_82217/g.129441 Transcript_82217/m.129441 type:complete len:135 (-) Transcript_82217:308-712(-)
MRLLHRAVLGRDLSIFHRGLLALVHTPKDNPLMATLLRGHFSPSARDHRSQGIVHWELDLPAIVNMISKLEQDPDHKEELVMLFARGIAKSSLRFEVMPWCGCTRYQLEALATSRRLAETIDWSPSSKRAIISD